MKVVAPAKGCIEMDGTSGRRYRAKDGIFEMSERDAKAAMKFGTIQPSLSGGTKSRFGFRCRCGFGSFFSTCSRCGGHAVREAAV